MLRDARHAATLIIVDNAMTSLLSTSPKQNLRKHRRSDPADLILSHHKSFAADTHENSKQTK
jgi:hypothetical protein